MNKLKLFIAYIRFKDVRGMVIISAATKTDAHVYLDSYKIDSQHIFEYWSGPHEIIGAEFTGEPGIQIKSF